MTQPAPSWQDLYDLALAEMVFRRPDLQVLQGDVTDAMLCGIAAAGDADIRQSAIEFSHTFLDTSDGDALTRVADDRYGIQRVEATEAIGQVTIARSSSGAAVTLIAGTRIRTPADAAGQSILFELDAPASFSLGSNTPVVVAATAVEGGRDGNVGAGTNTEFVSAPSDSTITVTNVAGFAGGADEESDPALRARCRSFFATLRRGTLAALEFGAKQVPQVRVATAVEATNGLVSLYVSDEDGNSNAQMINLVIIELENWRAAGTVVQVLGGIIFEQDVELSITARAGVVVDATLVTQAVTGALLKLATGETLYRDTIQGAVKALDPDGIVTVTVTVPATDVAPDANQLIRAGAVTIG